MPTSRRSMLSAAGASLIVSQAAKPTGASEQALQGSVSKDKTTELFQRSGEANAALMRGDIARYRALNPHAADYTLMSPFGGTPTHGSDLTDQRWDAIGRFFRNGTFEHELVQSYASADMVVLAIIERCHVEVGGLPAQEWPLRVTLVYRREGTEWRLAHRHADPLGKGISLEQAATLARGEAT